MPIVHNTNQSKTVIHSNQTKSCIELNPGINKVSDEAMKIFGEKIKAMPNLKVVEKIVDQVPAQSVNLEKEKAEAEEARLKAEQEAKAEAEELAKQKAEEEAAAKAKAEEDAKEAEILAQIEKEEAEKKSKSKKGG